MGTDFDNKITNQSALDAFQQGVAEAVAQIYSGETVLYKLTTLFEGTALNVVLSEDLALALAAAEGHLQGGGSGAEVRIEAVVRQGGTTTSAAGEIGAVADDEVVDAELVEE
jgi:hypothetical protein